MEQYKKWLEEQIEVTLEDKDLQREHWAYCTAYKKLIEALPIHGVVRGGVFEMASVHGDKDLLKHTDKQLTANTPTEPLVGGGQAQNVREGKVINMQERERQEIYKKILKRGEPSA